MLPRRDDRARELRAAFSSSLATVRGDDYDRRVVVNDISLSNRLRPDRVTGPSLVHKEVRHSIPTRDRKRILKVVSQGKDLVSLLVPFTFIRVVEPNRIAGVERPASHDPLYPPAEFPVTLHRANRNQFSRLAASP